MSDSMIDQMVGRFLSWPLPKGFSPDCYITFYPELADKSNGWPIGTNLFTAEQAREMVKHMLDGVVPPEQYATEEEGEACMHGYFDGQSQSEPSIPVSRLRELVEYCEDYKREAPSLGVVLEDLRKLIEEAGG